MGTSRARDHSGTVFRTAPSRPRRRACAPSLRQLSLRACCPSPCCPSPCCPPPCCPPCPRGRFAPTPAACSSDQPHPGCRANDVAHWCISEAGDDQRVEHERAGSEWTHVRIAITFRSTTGSWFRNRGCVGSEPKSAGRRSALRRDAALGPALGRTARRVLPKAAKRHPH
jgi:hypothetical protein